MTTSFFICSFYSYIIFTVDAKFLYGDKVPEGWEWLVQRVIEGFGVGLDISGIVVEAQPGCGFNVGDGSS